MPKASSSKPPTPSSVRANAPTPARPRAVQAARHGPQQGSSEGARQASPQRSPPRPRAQPRGRAALRAALWLEIDGQSLGGPDRMALLAAVAEQGSITRGAQAMGISYKTAWDAIDAMNEAAGTPLVARASGGRGGGGTRLTAHGQRLVARFEQLSAAHERFVGLLSSQGLDLDRTFSLLQVVNVKSSARNQWAGTVSALRAGAVNDEVQVQMPGGARITAIVTHESTEALGLRVKQPVLVLVKAPAVMLATGLGAARVSSSNRLDGVVRSVRPGAVNAEVVLDTADGLQIVATVTLQALQELQLAPGRAATALVAASDILLACLS